MAILEDILQVEMKIFLPKDHFLGGAGSEREFSGVATYNPLRQTFLSKRDENIQMLTHKI